uniref:Tubulin--tyrosine ligase-like protein 9 n=1 Tax=Strigamia maritima TaxID=126957 RepID=T1JCA3_STRMM
MATQKSKKMKQRVEPVNLAVGTDFSVVNTANRVHIRELVSSLKDQKAHADLKKEAKFGRKPNNDILPVPLAKSEEQKIKRSLIYQHVSEEVSKWENIVHHNRLAEHINYPLESPDLRMLTAMETTGKFTPKTSLELQIATILHGSKNVLSDSSMLTEAEEEALKAMDLEEAMQRRQEVIKMRALQSYMEAKAHRKKKIKSKQYHRLLKKDRVNKERKEYEQLMQTDPNAATEKMDKLGKDRIIERMTLKHRGTGKWAKQLQTRAKYDKDARISLGEQLQINRQLVQKVRNDEGDSEKEEEEMKRDLLDDKKELHFDDEKSPWLAPAKANESEEDAEELTSAIDGHKNRKRKFEKEEEEEEEEEEDGEPKKVKGNVKKRKNTIERLGEKEIVKKTKNKITKTKVAEDLVEEEVKVRPRTDTNIETDFDKIESDVRYHVFSSDAPEKILKGGDDDMDDIEDDDEEHRMTLAEAFADDDVTSSFREQKDAAIKKDQPDAIDLFLPGWGHWGGAGVKENEKLKKKFTISVPKLKRKDDKLGNVILKEDKDKKLAKLQVSAVPFPFGNSYYFEKSMQVPLGKDWNTETGFRKLITPKVCIERGWIAYDEDIHGRNQWNLWWKASRWPPGTNASRFIPGQYINHIPHGGRITRKDTLARQLRCMSRVYGNVYSFSPLAFVLPHEFLKFINEYNKFKDTANNFWICKPTDQSGGQGILIFNNINDLMYSSSVVVQKYISHPFLISGYKFDLRLYVFVPSYHPLVIYIHRAGLVRFGTEKYTLNALQNKYIHLTNTSINKYSPGFDDGKGCVGPGCKWSFHQLRQLFRQMKICDWFLWQRISSIITLTLLCQVREATQMDNTFELYGFDVLVDSDLRPWLLEVNRNPSLNQDSEVDVDVKKEMLHDLMDLLGLEQCHLSKSLTIHPLTRYPCPRRAESTWLLTSNKVKKVLSENEIHKPQRKLQDIRLDERSIESDHSSSDEHCGPEYFGNLVIKSNKNKKSFSKLEQPSQIFPIHSLIRMNRQPPAKVGQFVRTFPVRPYGHSSPQEVSIRPTVVEVQSLIRSMENVAKTFDKTKQKDVIQTDDECCQALRAVLGEEIEVWVPSLD